MPPKSHCAQRSTQDHFSIPAARWPLLCLATLLLALIGCALPGAYSTQRAIARLQSAQAAEEEATALEYIWQNAEDLAFVGYDADGNRLSQTQERWWDNE